MKHTILKALGLAAVLALGIHSSAGAADQASGKPNVVFILVDNSGWGDLACYGGTTPTPRIDSIAKAGMRFTNYTVEAQCTPTRSAILSGRLPIRTGSSKVPLDDAPYGLCPWEYTMGNLFSDAGYATAAYGKWHVGDAGRYPTDHGFDEWAGIGHSSDEAGWTSYKEFRDLGLPAPQMYAGVKGQPTKATGVFDLKAKSLMDEASVKRSVSFIEKQAAAKKPFFLYLSYTHIHPPMTVHPDFAGKSSAGMYSDTIMEIDHRTGQVLDALKAAGVEKDTIVVFSSDNAGAIMAGIPGASNGPWRGHFFTPPYEGSYRTYAMISWPGHITADKVSDGMLSAVDWLPTLAGLVGESKRVPTDRPIDGVNAADYMTGKSETTGRDHVLYFGTDAKLMSVKWRDWKVMFRKSDGIAEPITDVQLPIVYNLKNDPGERSNLWEQQMDMAWVLRPAAAKIGAFMQSVAKYPNIKMGEDFKGYTGK